MSAFALSQILAGIAFAFGLASFQFKSRRTILLCLTSLTAFNSSHFLLLGRTAPAVLLILTGVRYLTATFSTDRKLMYLFILLSIGAFVATFKGPLGILAIAAVLLGTYGSFQSADRTMRLCFIAGNSLWLLHNILAWTPVAVIMEASFLTSNTLGYWRFYGARPARSPVPEG